MHHRFCRGLLCVVLPAVFQGAVRADVVGFDLVVSSSVLTISGNANVTGVGDLPFVEQGPGGLVTTYQGTILVDVNNLLAPTSLSIVSATLNADVNGTWAPANGGEAVAPPAPADYGVGVSSIGATGKVRDVAFNLTAGSTSVSGGSFALAGQTFAYTAGFLDVFSTLVDDGNSISLTGSGANTAAGTGTYSVAGDVATLTIPTQFGIPYTIAGNPQVAGTLSFDGTLVGTAAVPEPSSCVLMGVGALGGAAFWRKRRKR